jgi:hypothetical protein
VKAGEIVSLLFPYLSCAFFVEIFHLMLSVFYVYGKNAGVPLGAAAFIFLSAAIVGSFYGSSFARIALLLLYDVHIAVTAAMIVRAVTGNDLGVEVWLFALRSLLLPWELAAVFFLTGRSRSKDGFFP